MRSEPHGKTDGESKLHDDHTSTSSHGLEKFGKHQGIQLGLDTLYRKGCTSILMPNPKKYTYRSGTLIHQHLKNLKSRGPKRMLAQNNPTSKTTKRAYWASISLNETNRAKLRLACFGVFWKLKIHSNDLNMYQIGSFLT